LDSVCKIIGLARIVTRTPAAPLLTVDETEDAMKIYDGEITISDMFDTDAGTGTCD
jgi:hypothetical protein